jgi:choline dehydrogenase
MTQGFDFIVIGAGTAGCVVAARLSQDPAVSVLLLEAGGPNDDARIETPAKFGALVNTKFDWGFRTCAQAELHNRQIYYPRGRTIGGTGSINYMIYLRGHPSDFNYWSQLGCEGWGWNDVLPYFKRSEDNRKHTDDLHGASGPVVVDDQSERSPLTEIFVDACQDTGIPFNPDLNGAEIEGCGYFPATLENNERCSSATAYLKPAGSRENLTIESGATVTRIVLKGNRAVGVDYFRHGQSFHAHAGSEIILCAGAIGSPQLLQLSGIGPPALLKSAGVEALHDLPGVGENLQDHLHYRSRWEITKPLTFFDRSAEELEDVQRRYDNDRSGALTTNHFESGAFLNSRGGLAAPDIELLMIPFFISLHATELRPPDRGS